MVVFKFYRLYIFMYNFKYNLILIVLFILSDFKLKYYLFLINLE